MKPSKKKPISPPAQLSLLPAPPLAGAPQIQRPKSIVRHRSELARQWFALMRRAAGVE